MHSRVPDVVKTGGGPNRTASWVALGASVVAGLLIGPLAAPARAAFSTPVPLSTADVVGAKEAIDPTGDVTAVWSHHDDTGWRVQAQQISSAGTRGPVKTLSTAAQKPLWPQVTIDTFDYGAIVVWSQSDGKNSRIKARHISPHGRLGPVTNLSGRGRTAAPRIAGGKDGGAIVVWPQAQRRSWRIKARKISPTGSLSPAKRLSSASKKSKDPEIASDGRGDAVVVWSQRGGANSRIKTLSGPVKARRIKPSGRMGSVKTLSDPGRGSGDAQVAIDDHGHAVAVWSQTNKKGAKPRVKARRIGAATGARGRVKNLSTKNSGDPDIASGVRGNVTVVWDTARGTKGSVQARQISPAGVLGRVLSLSAPGGSANSPQIASDGGGHATAVWYEYVYPNMVDWHVQARQISVAGTLGPLQTISTAASSVRRPQIAYDDERRAFAIWSQLDGGAWRAWGARGP
jgi:hypothetical protein